MAATSLGIQSSELSKTLESLNRENERYSGYVGRIAELGHRLRNTATPQDEKSEVASGPGLINTLHDEVFALQALNDSFGSVLTKLEEII